MNILFTWWDKYTDILTVTGGTNNILELDKFMEVKGINHLERINNANYAAFSQAHIVKSQFGRHICL